MLKRYDVFTDGACSGNPGRGGWGVILRCNGGERILSGFNVKTTNNRMELTAPIMALEQLKEGSVVHITTDSQYVQKGMTVWLSEWKRRGWRTTSRKAVKNQDLWMRLDALASMHQVVWHWVKGHSGHRENEYADQLATLALDRIKN